MKRVFVGYQRPCGYAAASRGSAQMREGPSQRVQDSATANGTPMSTSAGADDRRMTICPACGYPRLGAGPCAACVQIPPAAPIDPTMNTFAGASHFNPAAHFSPPPSGPYRDRRAGPLALAGFQIGPFPRLTVQKHRRRFSPRMSSARHQGSG